MNSSRWRQISPLLDEALSFSSNEERSQWLERLREQQPDVAGDVLTMLATHRAVLAEGFLDSSPLLRRPPALMPGANLGPYAITNRIGAGGMGEVYSAKDTRLGRTVAIKVLGPDLDLTGERRRRFLREAQAVSALNHPNIVTLHDIGRDDGVDYLVMEYVDGPTLDDVLRRGPLSMTEAVAFGRQIAEAMVRAHASGVLHRDLKPSNVILTADGTVKVLDFGLAKTAAEVSTHDSPAVLASPTLTRAGVVSGTPAYMSPEQAEGRVVDERSDIFSFGALFYEMVTGVRAFQSGSSTSAVTEVQRKDPKPIRTILPDVPSELEHLIERCLQKTAADRVQRMADIAATLRSFETTQWRSPASARRSSWVWWSVPAIVLIGLAGWLSLRPGESSSTRFSSMPLTSHPGSESSATLSPDGSRVAYIADHADGNPDLYVQATTPGATPDRITATPEPESWPAWSPDGRWIAFLRRFPNQRQQTILLAVADGRETVLLDEGCFMLVWTRDSHSIVCGSNSAGSQGLRVLAISGGGPSTLTEPPPGLFDMFPAASPDGKTIAFVRASRSSPARELYEFVMDSERGVARQPQVRHRFAGVVGSLTYVGANNLLASVQPDNETVGGDMRITRIALDRRPVEPVFLDLPEGSLFRPAVADGRLVYSQQRTRHEIWRTRDGVEEQHPVTSIRGDEGARFSPDGTRIAFVSARSGEHEIWLARADGSQATQLTTLGGIESVNWAPDGTWLVFSRREAGFAAIYRVPASGGAARRLTTGANTDLRPSVSRDGGRVYYSSDRTGRREVYRMTADGRDAVAFTSDGGDFPEETFDGLAVVYVRTNGSVVGMGALWLTPVAGGPSRQLPARSLGVGGFVIGREGVYVRTSLTSRSISIYEPATGAMRPVLTLTGSNELSAISPDGRVLLWTHHVLTASDLMIVNNFR